MKRSRTPSFAVTFLTILLPVSLMLVGGWADKLSAAGSRLNASLHLIGSADMSLLIGVLVGFVTFGLNLGFTRQQLLKSAGDSLPPTANTILLIGAGGGFGRILQDSNVSSAFVELAQHSHMPILFTAWLLAALIRLATGSSTVAMTTAAGMIAPLALHSTDVRPELLVIATGAGSIIFSHVNDGGFWLVKEYLDMSVVQTLKSWSVLETLLSVTGLVLVLAASTL